MFSKYNTNSNGVRVGTSCELRRCFSRGGRPRTSQTRFVCCSKEHSLLLLFSNPDACSVDGKCFEKRKSIAYSTQLMRNTYLQKKKLFFSARNSSKSNRGMYVVQREPRELHIEREPREQQFGHADLILLLLEQVNIHQVDDGWLGTANSLNAWCPPIPTPQWGRRMLPHPWGRREDGDQQYPGHRVGFVKLTGVSTPRLTKLWHSSQRLFGEHLTLWLTELERKARTKPEV